MIPVAPQPAPADFDQKVGRPGLSWLAEQGITRGPVASGLKWKTLWKTCLPQLQSAYAQICAYSAILIDPVTGSASVEHFLPKKHYPQQAYTWSNYRLVCGRMNGRKGEHQDVLDPFGLKPASFLIDFSSGSLHPNPKLAETEQRAVLTTIARLQLNDGDCRALRCASFDAWRKGEISFTFLRKHSPFVASEIQRQGLLTSP
ncbi:MAG: hypothetical protein RIR00_889 [Pseudomonadota bacterium]|jgi:uncharacterized protein (TIGR02646 family)